LRKALHVLSRGLARVEARPSEPSRPKSELSWAVAGVRSKHPRTARRSTDCLAASLSSSHARASLRSSGLRVTGCENTSVSDVVATGIVIPELAHGGRGCGR
jgi:hypothetical protein